MRSTSKRYHSLCLQKRNEARLHRKRSRLGTYVDPDEFYFAEQFGLPYETTDPLFGS